MRNGMLFLGSILAVYLVAVLIIYPPKLFKTKLRWVSWILLIWIGVMAASVFSSVISDEVCWLSKVYGMAHPYITIDEYGVKSIDYPGNGIFYDSFTCFPRIPSFTVQIAIILFSNLILIFPIAYFLKRAISWRRPLLLSLIPVIFYICLVLVVSFKSSALNLILFGKPGDQLIGATQINSKILVKYYLNHGYDVNYKDKRNNDSLFYAIRQNNPKIVSLLLKYPVDSKSKDTGLHLVPWGDRDTTIMSLLINNGANINSLDNNGKTLFSHAYTIKDKPLVDLMLKNGIDLHAKDSTGKTVIHYAAGIWSPDLLEYILPKVSDLINEQDNEGNTPLMESADSRYYQNIKILLKNGAKVNVQNKQGESALFIAIFTKNYNEASTLIEIGADWNVSNKKGYSISHEVFSECSTDFIEYYLKKTGYGINQKDKKGMTPIVYAIEGRNLEAVKYLISHGANVKIKNKKGKGLLSFDNECWNEKERREMLRILGEAGATY